MLMGQFLKSVIQNKPLLLLIIFIILVVVAGLFSYQKFFVRGSTSLPLEEVDLTFDPEGPYALLFPRRDGNALNLVIKRVASFEEFSYQIAYADETGVDRGAGSLDTWIKLPKNRSEYEQEILFGTCSTGGTCVYDKGVENGTLILRIKKGNKAFRMTTQWHLQKPDLQLGKLFSGDAHFAYDLATESVQLSLVKFTIINDLTGAPKLPSGKAVLGKVYALNTPQSKSLPEGMVTIELVQTPSSELKIARFDETGNQWVEYETKIEGSSLFAQSESGGIFSVLAPLK